jgi:anti-sigma factor RsiW
VPRRRDTGRGRLRCRAVAKLIQRYLDVELADTRAVLIADHLDLCPRCGLDAQTWRWLKGAIAGLAPPDDPDQVARLRSFMETLPG